MANIKQVYSALCEQQAVLRELESKYNRQKKLVEELKQDMVQQMLTVGTDSYKSSMGTVSMTTNIVPTVTDWQAVYNYIHVNEAYDLLQRRVSSTAWKERLEDGEIPGIEPFEKLTLRVNLS